MDEKPRTIANLDDDETADTAAVSGPLGKLVERELGARTVEPEDAPKSATPSPPGTTSTDYAEGTTEHDDDREQ